MNDTRTARIIAVMAGNAFFVAKIAEHWIQAGYPLLLHVQISVVVALLGLASAYLSLFWPPEKRWPLVLEIASDLCFVGNVVWWLSQIRVPHG